MINMNGGSYWAYKKAGRCNEDYDIDKGIYEGREDYKVDRADHADGKYALLIISIADDDSKTIEETTFYVGDRSAVSEFIRAKFGDKKDEDADIPLYQSIPDWADSASDGDKFYVGENCECCVVIVDYV